MKSLKPHIALFVCNSIWAINYPFYHIIMEHGVSATTMLELSLLVAAVLSFVPLLWSRGERVDQADVKYLVAAAILSGLMRKGFVIFGLSLTTPIEASIIASLLPVMALVISVIMGVDRFSVKRVIGIALGMGGAVAIIMNSGDSGKAASSLWGNLLMLFYTVAAGFYMVWLQPIFKKYSSLTLMRWIYTLSSLMFLPFSFKAIETTNFAALSPHLLLIALFVITVPTFLPNLLLNYSLGQVTPTVSSIYSYLQPVLAISISVWLGLGKLHWSTLIYGIVIICGVTLVLRSYARRQITPPQRNRSQS